MGLLVIHPLQFSSLDTSSGYVGKFKLFDVRTSVLEGYSPLFYGIFFPFSLLLKIFLS